MIIAVIYIYFLTLSFHISFALRKGLSWPGFVVCWTWLKISHLKNYLEEFALLFLACCEGLQDLIEDARTTHIDLFLMILLPLDSSRKHSKGISEQII